MADYIDRNAAIEALRKLADECPGSTEAATAAAMAISVLSRLPGPWVSAKERLPESSGLYLCEKGYLRDGLVHIESEPYWILRFFADTDRPHFELEGLMGLVVTRWMELPDAPEVGK